MGEGETFDPQTTPDNFRDLGYWDEYIQITSRNASNPNNKTPNFPFRLYYGNKDSAEFPENKVSSVRGGEKMLKELAPPWFDKTSQGSSK